MKFMCCLNCGKPVVERGEDERGNDRRGTYYHPLSGDERCRPSDAATTSAYPDLKASPYFTTSDPSTKER